MLLLPQSFIITLKKYPNIHYNNSVRINKTLYDIKTHLMYLTQYSKTQYHLHNNYLISTEYYISY